MIRSTISRIPTMTFSLIVAAAFVLSSGACSKQGYDEQRGSDTSGSQQVNAEQADAHKLKKEWSEAMQTLKRYSIEQREQARDVAQQTLAKMDERIEQLEARANEEWDEWSQEVRQRHKDTLHTLRKQRKELAQWYGEMKNSSADAWEEVKQGFVDAYGELTTSLGNAQSEFDNQDDK